MPPVAIRVVEGAARTYKRTWKGSVVTAFLNPILFLVAMGLGLGTLVDRSGGAGGLGGLSYVAFIAPGLLAATAMQTGTSEAMWPVMAGIKWIKTYHATLATPVRVIDLVFGNLVWVGLRVLMACSAFAAVAMAFGAIPIERGLVALLPAVVTGLAFAAPVTAYTASIKDETRLSALMRFGIIPMFLFSGTFFPVRQLPEMLQPLAQITPLWHGVELCRSIALGSPPDLPTAVHAAYLVGLAVVGFAFATRSLRKKLQP